MGGDGDMDWESFLEDFDGDGDIDDKDERKAKMRAKMRKGKRGRRGSIPTMTPNMNWSDAFEQRMAEFALGMDGLGERISGKKKG